MMNQETIKSLAMSQLGLPANTDRVPKFYLNCLTRHALVFKDDQNFHVSLQPGSGYGLVQCLETGCAGMTIELTKRDSGDGGLKDGFGDLYQYQKHIRTHEPHGRSRLARLQGHPYQAMLCENKAPAPVTPHVSEPRVNSKGTLRDLDHLLGDGSTVVPYKSLPLRNATNSPAVQKSDSFEELMSRAEADKADVKLPTPRSTSEAAAPSRVSSMNRLNAYNQATTIPESSSSRSPMFGSIVIPQKRDFVSSQNKGKETDTKKPLYPDAKRSRLSYPGPSIFSVTSVGSSDDVNAAPRPVHVNSEELGQLRSSIQRYDGWIRANDSATRVLNRRKNAVGELSKTQESHLRSLLDVNAYYIQGRTADEARLTELLGTSAAGPLVGSTSAQPPIPRFWKEDVSQHSVLRRVSDVGVLQPAPVQFAPRLSLPSTNILAQVINQFSQENNGSSDLEDIPVGRRVGSAASHLSVQEFIESTDGFDESVKVEDGLKKLGLPSMKHRLNRMSILLLPHQVLGVAWMLDREKSRDSGGILADEMGLGNIQTIATMTQNQSDDPACKTTLIVAPVALLSQWKSEIEMATDDCFRIFIYHGQNRLKDKRSIQKYDVVITSYGTLAAQFPNYDRLQKEKSRKRDDFIDDEGVDDGYESEVEKKKWAKGLLLQFGWYRIILDEAHTIRNRKTHVSSAVVELMAQYRWCLTGTPIMNGLNDAYPLFRFLNIRPWHDWTIFKDHISGNESKNAIICATKLQAIFKATMLRRKKDSLLDGKPLVTLPPRHMFDVELYFSPEEAEVYKFVADRSNAVFNKYLREGTVLKNYAHVLIMLLRLRQICVHPCLIEEYANVFRTPEELSDVLKDDLQRAFEEQGATFVKRITKKIVLEVEARVHAAQDARTHQEREDLLITEESCPVCYEPLGQDAVITRCEHSFCEECLDRVLEIPLTEESSRSCKADERPCPVCRGPISKKFSYRRAAFEPREAVQDEPDREVDHPSSPGVHQSGKRKHVARRKARPAFLDSDEEESDCDSLADFIADDDEDEDEKEDQRRARKQLRLSRMKAQMAKDREELTSDDEEPDGGHDRSMVIDTPKGPAPPTLSKFLPSTKMQHMMKLLLEWRDQYSRMKTETSLPQSDWKIGADKVMIVSQWTSVLDLCASYLEENSFNFVMYTGKMSARRRNESVSLFMTNPKVTVMLMSLKAGGIGLNLTRANRVISLDLAWNSASENQAFDRVHRLGQQKAVSIHRLTIRNTVEARVLELQKRKQELAEGSLGEGSGKRIGRLSMRELHTMFGLTGSRDGA